MLKWKKLFERNQSIIGMIHVPALPGTPKSKLSVKDIVKHVLKEAEIYIRCGVDGILVENMHDIPYQQPQSMGPEVASVMTKVCSEIRKLVPPSVPCGVQVLAAGNKEALAVAVASEFQFIRCEGFVFSHVADEGWTNSCAAELMRYRKLLGCDDILVLTDIKKKHSSHAVTNDVSLVETALAAEFFLSNGIILTGIATGSPANKDDLQLVRTRSSLPLLIGSGITSANVENYKDADGLIVGSFFKNCGRWDGDLSEDKVSELVEKVKMFKSL